MSAKNKRILGWCMISLPFTVMLGMVIMTVPEALIGVLIFGAVLWLLSTGVKLITSEDGEQGSIANDHLENCRICGTTVSNKANTCLVCGTTIKL